MHVDAELSGLSLLAQVVDEAFAGVLIETLPTDGTAPVVRYANHALHEITGFREGELVGRPSSVLLADPDGAETARRMAIVGAGERVEETVVGCREDGSTYPMRIRMSRVQTQDGSMYSVAFIRDMTAELAERERASRAEEQLAQQHAYMKALIENSLDSVVLLDETGSVRFGSPTIGHVLGYAAGDLVGKTVFEFVHPDDLAAIGDALRVTLGSDGPAPAVRTRARHQDGSWKWVEATVNNRLADPSVGAVVVSIRDVVERVAAEEAIQLVNERYRLLVDHLPIVTYRVTVDEGSSPDERFVSRGIEELLGVSVEEWTADRIWRGFIFEEDRPRVLAAWDGAVADRTPFDEEYRMVRRDGRSVWVRERAVIVEREGRWHAEGVFQDVSVERAATENLRAAEERYRTLIEQLPLVTYIWEVQPELSPDPQFYQSPQIAELLGYTAQEWNADPYL